MHKNDKMNAAYLAQAMKVDIGDVMESIENYIRTHRQEYEHEIQKRQKKFLADFNLHQDASRSEDKAQFAAAIKKVFYQGAELIRSIIAAEKVKEELLRVYEATQNDFLELLGEQVLIIANKNLIAAKEEALNTAKTSSTIIAILLIIILLFGVTTGIIFGRSIIKPLKQLVNATQVVAKGNFSNRVNIKSEDELGMLGNSFNKMIDQLEQAEAKQATLLTALKKSNVDLENFAHVVSHDLKAPLRGIHTLAEYLSTINSAQLGEEGVQQLNLLRGRVKRMFDMIDGILRYSKIGREAERKETIDMNQFVKGVVDLVTVPDNIAVKIQKNMPSVLFDKVRLQQVFQNLISNAVKYMDKERGLIRINCTDESIFWRFSVSDNGPGIEEKCLETIFELFQTINPKDEKESTGVGLTIVKKIIENAGGKIWVESKVNEGSIFNFTLLK